MSAIGQDIKIRAAEALETERAEDIVRRDTAIAKTEEQTARALTPLTWHPWRDILADATRDGYGGLELAGICYEYTQLARGYCLTVIARHPDGGLAWHWEQDGTGVHSMADLGAAIEACENRESSTVLGADAEALVEAPRKG